MYIILRIKNSSPIIIKDAKEWQLKKKALDDKLEIHKPKPLSLCPCFVFKSSTLHTCLKNSVYSSFSTIVILGVKIFTSIRY